MFLFALLGCVSPKGLTHVEALVPTGFYFDHTPCPYEEIAVLTYQAWGETRQTTLLDTFDPEQGKVRFPLQLTGFSTEEEGASVTYTATLIPEAAEARFRSWLDDGRADAILHVQVDRQDIEIGKADCKTIPTCEVEDAFRVEPGQVAQTTIIIQRFTVTGVAVKWMPGLCGQ